MSYDVCFCVDNEESKSKVINYFEHGSWEQKDAQEFGSFYSLSGWCYSSFIQAMRAEIGRKAIEETDFYVRVSDLWKIASAIEAFAHTEGAKKFQKYIDIFNVQDFRVYDPELPFSKEFFDMDRDYWDERACWLSLDQVFEMKKALMSAGNFMEGLWKIARSEGCWMNDFPKVVKDLFADASDDELIIVSESY